MSTDAIVYLEHSAADYIYNLISVAISLKQLPVRDCDSLTSASVWVQVHCMCLLYNYS